MVLQRRINADTGLGTFLDDFFKGHQQLFNAGNEGFPRTDIYTLNNKLYFDFALAGWNKEQVEIDMNPETNVLTVKSIDKSETKDSDLIHWHQRELSRRNFTVRYSIPSCYNRDSIEATFENGILSVEFTKNPEMAPKQVQIK